jgi:hypothetical protein
MELWEILRHLLRWKGTLYVVLHFSNHVIQFLGRNNYFVGTIFVTFRHTHFLHLFDSVRTHLEVRTILDRQKFGQPTSGQFCILSSKKIEKFPQNQFINFHDFITFITYSQALVRGIVSSDK